MKSEAALYNTVDIAKHPSLRKPFFQPKLTINQPGDSFEQEADAMADHVMQIPSNSFGEHRAEAFFKPASLSNLGLQRKHPHSEKEEKLQRKETNDESLVADAPTENYISSLNGKGKSLTQSERSFFEPRFDHDFSDVQLHTGAEANQSAKGVSALAYTHGNNIVFGSGQYQPDTENGQKLMAHELTHVVQQSAHPSSHNSVVQKKDDKKQQGGGNGTITLTVEKKVKALNIWENALGSLDLVKNTATGATVLKDLKSANVNITVVFVAVREDIPVKNDLNALGYTKDLGKGAFNVFVLAGKQDYYFERQGIGEVEMDRTVAAPQHDIADTLFHELLHAWFMTYHANAVISSGHTGLAQGLESPKFDDKEYDPEFLNRLKSFKKEFNNTKAKP